MLDARIVRSLKNRLQIILNHLVSYQISRTCSGTGVLQIFVAAKLSENRGEWI